MKIFITSNKQIVFPVYLLLITLFSSCEEFVEIDLPPNELTGAAVFTNITTAEAALMDIYALQRDQGILSGEGGVSILMAYYTDELAYLGSQGSGTIDIAQHNILPGNSTIQNIWTETYNSLYAVNSLIEGLGNPSLENESELDRLKGEAYFLRGLLHYYLTELFGAVPYITTTNYLENSSVERLSREEVFPLILDDLLLAKSLLPEDYTDTYRVRPNKWAASTLISRIAILTTNYEMAENEATKVINSGMYSLEVLLEEVFLYEGSNTIWQFKPSLEGINTLEARSFIINSAPPSTSALRDEFILNFRDDDKRKEVWIDSVSQGETSWYFPNKYKEDQNTDSSVEYSKILRIAEVYLIRAEARLKEGDLVGALEDINRIRNRIGMEPIEGADEDILWNEIIYHRTYELFTEFGHRWFDLRRFEIASEILEPIKPGWGEHSYFLPIPENELIANPNLSPQNPGY